MSDRNATREIYAKNFPVLRQTIAEADAPPVPDLPFALYVLLRAAGMHITFAETDILCGQATQFIYLRDQGDQPDIHFLPPVETLFKAIHVSWIEVTPSDASAAFRVAKEWIQHGFPLLARFKQPLLIYGCSSHEWEDRMILIPAVPNGVEVSLTATQCMRDYWRFPFDEANLILRIETAPRDIPDLSELCTVICLRAVKSWRTVEIGGCAAGDHAYQRLLDDLGAVSTLDHRHHSTPWIARTVIRQIWNKKNCASFFERVAPRFGGAERKAYGHSSFCYQQCAGEWSQAAAALAVALDSSHAETLTDSPAGRGAAALHFTRAREWEQKATNELLRVIG